MKALLSILFLTLVSGKTLANTLDCNVSLKTNKGQSLIEESPFTLSNINGETKTGTAAEGEIYYQVTVKDNGVSGLINHIPSRFSAIGYDLTKRLAKEGIVETKAAMTVALNVPGYMQSDSVNVELSCSEKQ